MLLTELRIAKTGRQTTDAAEDSNIELISELMCVCQPNAFFWEQG